MSGFKDQLGENFYHYPQTPGYRDPLTSRDAAEMAAPRAEEWRGRVIALLQERSTGVTVHEAAAHFNVRVATIQPRFSELVKMEKIVRSGERRMNESGASAAVWVLA